MLSVLSWFMGFPLTVCVSVFVFPVSPRNVELVEDDERDVCVINWTKPCHGNHQAIIGYRILCKARSQYHQGETWTVLEDGNAFGWAGNWHEEECSVG